MGLPVKVHAGVEDVPLAGDIGVRARVARLAVEWASSAGGGMWALDVPVVVIDGRKGRRLRRITPVIDPTLALAALSACIWLVSAINRRRVRGDG